MEKLRGSLQWIFWGMSLLGAATLVIPGLRENPVWPPIVLGFSFLFFMIGIIAFFRDLLIPRSRAIGKKASGLFHSWRLKRKIGPDALAISWWLSKSSRTILEDELREVYRGHLTDDAFELAFKTLVENGGASVSNTSEGVLVRPHGPKSKYLATSDREEKRIQARFSALPAQEQVHQVMPDYTVLESFEAEAESLALGTPTYEAVASFDRRVVPVLSEGFKAEYEAMPELIYTKDGRDSHGRRRMTVDETTDYYRDSLNRRKSMLGTFKHRVASSEIGIIIHEQMHMPTVKRLIGEGEKLQLRIESTPPRQEFGGIRNLLEEVLRWRAAVSDALGPRKAPAFLEVNCFRDSSVDVPSTCDVREQMALLAFQFGAGGDVAPDLTRCLKYLRIEIGDNHA